jgi:hypothetical protein
MVKARQMVGTIIPNGLYTKSEFSVDVNKLTKVELEHSFFLQSQGLRETPYAILLYGPSGVGKSYLMRKLTEHILMVNGFNHDESAYCFLNCHSKFYDSLKSNTQCICLDEIANATPVTSTVNECDFILNILNNVFFAAPMAEAHQKGKVMVNNKVFAATTNVPNINASYWSQEPLAVLRRFQCRITANVVKEYATGQMLDVDKALRDFPNDKLQNVWRFKVEQAYGIMDNSNPVHATPAWRTLIHDGKFMESIDIITLMQWLVIHSRKHFANQKSVLQRSKFKMAVCDKCSMFCEVCPCLPEEEITFEPVEKEDKELQVGYLVSSMFNAAVKEYIVDPWYDTITNGVKNAVIETFDVLIPTYTERRLFHMHCQVQAIANWKYFNRSRYNWLYEITPHWLMATNTFEKLYMYLERKNMTKFMKHSMLAITASTMGLGYLECRKNGKPRKKVLGTLAAFWSLMNVSATIYVKKRFDKLLAERRDATYIREQARKELQSEDKNVDWREKAFRIVGGAATLAAGATLISALILSYKMWKSSQEEKHSLLDPQNEDEIKLRDATKNPWRTNPVFSDEKKATHTADQLVNSISGCLFGIIVDGLRTCSAFMVCSGAMIMPYHMWFVGSDMKNDPLSEISVQIVSAPFEKEEKPITGNVSTIMLDWDNCYRIPAQDMVMCQVLAGPRKDLRKYLSETPKLGQYVSVRRTAHTGELIKGFGVATDFHNEYWPGSDCKYVQYETRHNVNWVGGDCCTLLISNDANPVIMGMHLVGIKANALRDKRVGYSAILDKRTICLAHEALQRQLGLHELHSEGALPLTVCGKSINFQSKIAVTPLNWIHNDVEFPEFTYYGTVDGGFTATSQVRTSIIAKDLEDMTKIPHVWGPPNFNPPDEKGIRRKWLPWYIGLVELTNPCSMLNAKALKWAIKDFSQPIIESLMKGRVDDVHPLTHDQILNGISGKRFIDKMNFKSSMGFPLSGVKSKYLVIDPESGRADFIDGIFWEEMKIAEQKYLRGEMCNHIFKACLKDEVTKVRNSEGKLKKARIFQAAPITMQLLTRKYYLPVIRWFCMHPILTECAVGINCFSLEWEELYSHMTKFVENDDDVGIFAGDYSAWDQRCPCQLVVAAMSIMISVAENTGNYTADDIMVMKGIMTDLAYCLVNFNGSLIRFRGMMPSGHNLTAVLNSNANSLLLRTMYYQMCLEANTLPSPFRDSVSISTYGDDVFGSVHKRIRHIFNIKMYSEKLRTKVKMGFTMPDKTKIMPDFIRKDDNNADFLKRQSKYVEGLVDNGNVPIRVGVIELDSIVKSLYCVKCSKAQERNNLVATMMSALHELFFHGREVYEEWCNYLNILCENHKMVLPIVVPTFDERIVDWKVKYLHNLEVIDGSLSDNISNSVYLNEHLVDVLVTHCDYSEACINDSILEDLVIDKSSSRNPVDWGLSRLFNRSNKVKESKEEIDGVSDQYTRRESSRIDDLQLHAGGSEVVTTFNIIDGDQSMVRGTINDINLNTQHMDSDLKEFFKRPLLIRTVQLSPDEVYAEDINPVTEYMLNPRISNRLNNYAWFKGTMCVKFETNGSNFHYGRFIAAVNHWPTNDTTYNVLGTPMTACTVLPHIMIDPTDATGGCLEIPLFHPFNMIPFRNIFDLVNVCIRTISPLRMLNTADPAGNITLNVWAWFKDIHLAMPTQADVGFLAPQADEYDKPSVVATSAANMVGHLRDAPIVGNYARATELALRGAAQVASAFGYSRPTVTNDNGRMIIHPIGNLANTNVVDTSTKLALDAKQEVTVDATVTGFDGEDSMDIAAIAGKRMLINKYEWTYAATAPSQQFIMNVTPMQCVAANLPASADSTAFLISPSAHMAAPFKYWRGSMEITVEVVASAFHKGKLRIVYDPLGVIDGVGNWNTEYNINYSAVIDIAQSRTYTMKVGWGNSRSYCLTTLPDAKNSYAIGGGPDFLADNTDNAYANGRLGIHILTPLTSVAGVATNAVYVNIYANMCPDFQVAVPKCDDILAFSTNMIKTIPETSDFQLQAGELEQVPGPMVAENAGLEVDLNMTNEDSQLWESKFNMVHIGEEIKSIRQVIKRYCVNSFFPFRVGYARAGTVSTNKSTILALLPAFPQYGGWSTSDVADTDIDFLLSIGGSAFVPAPYQNWLTWYSPGFLMRRGSVRNKWAIEGGNGADFQIENMTIMNSPISTGTRIVAATNITYTQDADTLWLWKTNVHPTTSCGAFMNYPAISNIIDGEIPYQSDRGWYFAQNRNLEDFYPPHSLRQEVSQKLFVVTAVSQPSTTGGMRRYTAAGEDFSFIYYKYPPLVIRTIVTSI